MRGLPVGADIELAQLRTYSGLWLVGRLPMLLLGRIHLRRRVMLLDPRSPMNPICGGFVRRWKLLRVEG